MGVDVHKLHGELEEFYHDLSQLGATCIQGGSKKGMNSIKTHDDVIVTEY